MAATARSINDDPFQNHRFHIFDTSGFFQLSLPAAGFSTISLPEMNIDMGEYREGNWTYARKYPTRPHFTQVSLHKGVMTVDSNLWQVALASVEGKKYRTNIIIKHFHRSDVSGVINYRNSTAKREIHCFNCMPTRFRPSSDFDALNSDISIEELDLEVEYFRIFLNGQEVGV